MLPDNSDPIQILLFEDNDADTELIVKNLDSSGLEYKLAVAKRLSEGLETIRAYKFDVILIDPSLPDSKGSDTLEAIQGSESEAAKIILTGSEDEGFSIVALKAGAQDHLFKDKLSGYVLRRSIRHAVERGNLNKKLEAHASEIEHRESLLNSIFDANADAMLILTQEYEIKLFNPAAAKLLDAQGSSLIGEIFPFEVSTSNTSELEIPEDNGSIQLVELNAIDLVWKGEKALLVTLHDITEHRTTELELKREKERLSAILDLIDDAVIATDHTGKVERLNHEAARLTGVSNEDAIGKQLSEVLRLRNQETGKIIENPSKYLLNPAFAENMPSIGLILESNEDESPIFVSAAMRTLIDDEDKHHHGFVTVLRDITKQKKTEEDLFKIEKLNAISLLAGGIAHDFNNMLTGVLGNISIVRMGMQEGDENSRNLLAAETAALQAKSLTHQLLTFSKGGVPSLEITSIDKLVEESAQFILRGSNVKCEVEKEASLWHVDADKGQISQVVNNLIINADQAMPKGGTVSLKLRNRTLRDAEVPDLKAGEYVCIEITDQGVGIDAEDIKRIFDPYYTTKDEGNGLGLASSHSIITNHHGAMTVESEIGKGSCFSVLLPRAKDTEAVAKITERDTSQNELQIHKGRGRILVMDDMEAMMTVAGEILNVLGYEVEFATNGEDAIKAYKKAKESGNPFDAAVFDLTVPGGMGGEEASNILREYDPDLIAIASSGFSTSNIMSDYKDSAFKAVVPKPYRIKEMSDALHRLLHGGELHGGEQVDD